MTEKVFITGGSKGIGRALVYIFQNAGYDVTFSYRTGKADAQKIVSDFPKHQRPASVYLDLSNHASIEDCFSLHRDTDILILNAGLGSKTVEAITKIPHEQDQQLMQVNALGSLAACQLCLPVMKRRNAGKIILLSSVGGGVASFPGFKLADLMSKAAISCLGRQLGAELASTGIDIFTVCPGATDTDMFRKSTLDHLPPSQRAGLIENLPGQRLISPDEIAQLCLYLCQPEGRILRGAVLDASLGLGSWPATLNKEA